MGLNAVDLYAMQECLIGYRKLIEWIPPTTEVEMEMKHDRVKVINHLIDITDKEIVRISEVFRNEDVRE